MKIAYLFIIGAFLTTCSRTTQISDKIDLISFTATVIEHQPYCGGAKPSAEKEKGSFLAFDNQVFFIKNGTINHDTIPIIKEIITDPNGKFQCNLNPGYYSLLFPNKHKPYEVFYRDENKESMHLKADSSNCFKKWWQSPDAVFHIVDTTTQVRIIIKSGCNVGFNPCISYIGPKRP